MDETKIKKQLIRTTVGVVIASVLIFAAVCGVLLYVMQAAHESDHIQMKSETQEYKSRILKQIDANLQLLTTLAKSYETSDIMASDQGLAESLIATNTVTSFVNMAYFFTDETGFFALEGRTDPYRLTVADCHPYMQDTIRQALQGEQSISRMFNSTIDDEILFVYSVPVYQNGSVVGALAASDTLGIFQDIVNGNAVMGGQGYIHVLDSQGKFLVRSDRTLVKENVVSIFDGPYLSGDSRTAIQQALSNQESIYGDFEYRGTRCHFYIEPVGLNGWNLFCANQLWGPSLSFGRTILLLGGFLFFILIVMFFIVYYSYYKFRKNSALLLHLAYFDPLTGSINTLRFDQNVLNMQKEQKEYCIAAINIHNFKAVNDLFGVQEGDRVLCYIKKVIESHLHKEEFFCRDAADLFYLCLLDVDEATLRARMTDIVRTVSETTSHAKYSYELSLYCGLSINGTREKALVALQSIQNTRHISIAFYDAALHAKLRHQNRIESYMHVALQNHEFELFLQPKNDLKNDQVIGAEALVRWRKPDGTYRYPNEFIPLFESNGFCMELDRYMVKEVCQQIRAWINAGIHPIPISVNQSRLVFANANYPDELVEMVSGFGISPQWITLEILEGIAANDIEQISDQIQALHDKGFRISMDDFGSGYSSLNVLYQLKIDEIKLDRGFLRKGSEGNEQRRNIIISQIISFARKLGIATVAEGIETLKDKENMAVLGCDYGQGYFYDRPLSASAFSEKYMQNRPLSLPAETPPASDVE